MNPLLRWRGVVASLTLAVAGVGSAQAGLIHRYEFKDGAKDSAGKVDGALKGAGAAIKDGSLVLKNAAAESGDKVSCLEFTGSILPKGGTSVTLAVWFTAKDVGDFARVLNFGASEGTEGIKFIYFAPHTGDGAARAAITGSDVSSKTFIDADALDDGKLHLVAIVIDGAAKTLRLYVDGKEPKPAEALGDNTLDKVTPLENWVGRSSFAADPGLTATIDELRVYDHALSAEEVAAMAKAGAEALPAAGK